MLPLETSFIYALIDPRTGMIRYIGKTSRGIDRVQEHWKRKQERDRNDHCHAWIRSLLREKQIPDFEVLEYTVDFVCAEVFWIGYFRMVGADLTNMTEGGEGARQTLETRLKISKTMAGRASPLKGRKSVKRDIEVYKRIWKTRYEKYGRLGHPMSRSEDR